MAAVIHTNYPSLVARGYLNTNNNALNKSIERLSSGLRINHAADDASGLAISEKLRAQINGLGKASMNAQDAISFLQTAEGGMEVVGNMIQRMRELAVQAGNGTYTANDRKELQKEVDQLKQEVNRVSSSTEFNTKKLLTGSAAALWSTSDPSSLEAIVRGAPAQGNYRLGIEATSGENWVYKTDIMNLGDAARTTEAYEYTFGYASDVSNASFSNIYGEITGKTEITGTVNGSAAALVNTIGRYQGQLATGEQSTLTVSLSAPDAAIDGSYVVVEALKDGDLSQTTSQNAFKVTVYDGRTGERSVTTLPATDMPATPSLTIAGIGTISFAGTTKFAAGDKIVFANNAAITAAANTTVYRAGENGPWLADTGTTGKNLQFAVLEMDEGGKISVGAGIFDMANNNDGTNGTVSMTPRLTTESLYTVRNKTTTGVEINKKETRIVGGNYPNGLAVTVRQSGSTTDKVTDSGRYFKDINLHAATTGTPAANGSYIIEYVGANTKISAAASADFKVTFVDAATGTEKDTAITGYTTGGALSFAGLTVTYSGSNASHTAGDKMLVKTVDGTAATAGGVAVDADNLGIVVPAGNLDAFSIHNVQMDNTGNITKSRIELSLISNRSGVVTFGAPNASVADSDTKLKDITQFTNADGRMILENTQELTLFGNGKQLTITVEGNDTVEDFRSKLNKALVDMGMGTGNSATDANLVRYVTEDDAQASGHLAVAGTFIIQAGIVGDNSKISVIGDESLINALSMTDIQKGSNSEMKVTVSDAHNGRIIGTDTISDNMLRGVIEGIDVKLTNPKLSASYNSITGKISFTASKGDVSYDLHVVDNRTEVQIGANQGQTLNISIAQVNTASLEIDDAFVTTMDESQKAITKFDQALETIIGARATIGAQINRLEYTMQNLSTTKQNLSAAESRIRDLDVAEESATFARNQVLVNSAVAMVAQANQLPQTFLSLINGR